ncbi:MAG: NAD(+) kinase [Cellvibrionaceae bacterium]
MGQGGRFHTIGIIGRLGSQRVVYSIKRLIRFLEKGNYTVILEEHTAGVVSGHQCQVSSRTVMGETCDLVVVIGGDGSTLSAARIMAKYKVPLLGINRGRLGFLNDITPEEIETKVEEVLSGNYITERRFLLDMHLMRDNDLIGTSAALNDVVLHPGKSIRMLSFEVYIDGEFVQSQRSDGLIVSTPTGSTAYALSAGGPIMHPKLDAIVIVPMNPHALSSRPIVVNGDCEIKLVIADRNDIDPHVTCDGHEHFVTAPGDVIRIHKKSQQIELIHPVEHNFFETCRSKLGWGSSFVE